MHILYSPRISIHHKNCNICCLILVEASLWAIIEKQIFGRAAASIIKGDGWVEVPCDICRHSTIWWCEDPQTVNCHHYLKIDRRSHHNDRKLPLPYTNQLQLMSHQTSLIITRVHRLEYLYWGQLATRSCVEKDTLAMVNSYVVQKWWYPG